MSRVSEFYGGIQTCKQSLRICAVICKYCEQEVGGTVAGLLFGSAGLPPAPPFFETESVCVCVYVFPNLVPEKKKNQRDGKSVVFTCVFSPSWIRIQISFNFTFFMLEPFMLTCKFIQVPKQKNVGMWCF